MSNIVV